MLQKSVLLKSCVHGILPTPGTLTFGAIYELLQTLGSLTVRTITSSMTMAEYAEFHVEDTSAFMGLESYLTQDTFRGIRYRKETIIAAVLSEQRRQDRFDIYNSMYWHMSPGRFQTYQQGVHK